MTIIPGRCRLGSAGFRLCMSMTTRRICQPTGVQVGQKRGHVRKGVEKGGVEKGSRLNLQQFLHGVQFLSKIAVNFQTFLEAFDRDAYGGISDAAASFAQFR